MQRYGLQCKVGVAHTRNVQVEFEMKTGRRLMLDLHKLCKKDQDIVKSR
jgi:hypothetical protein